jgi:hypothetical protein
MCRLAFIDKRCKDVKFLTELITDLNESAGGDGIGVGWIENGIPTVFKGVKITPEEIASKIVSINSDYGILLHVRRASVGAITDINCHPFQHKDELCMHNGHIDAIGILKLMMLENLEKYSGDGWTTENIMSTPDSDIMAYFISKRGFNMAEMLTSGTVMVMNPSILKIWNGYQLQAIQRKGILIYASKFTDEVGMLADRWITFEPGSELSITSDGECSLIKGACYDAKLAWAENQKKNKKGKKGKYTVLDIVL